MCVCVRERGCVRERVNVCERDCVRETALCAPLSAVAPAFRVEGLDFGIERVSVWERERV